MIKDLRQFLKFYRIYKKGKEMEQTMIDKIKNWTVAHKIELAVTSAFVVGYKFGFRRGYKATNQMVTRFINDLDRVASKVINR